MRKHYTLNLHLGLPKTATTTLQRYFRQNVPGYFGSPGSLSPFGFFGPYRAAFLREAPEWWDKRDSAPLRRKLSTAVRRSARMSGINRATLSWEAFLTGHLFLGHQRGAPDELSGQRSVNHLAKLLRNAMPRVSVDRILLTVRRQPEWLASLYAQKSVRIQGASQRDFNDQIYRLLGQPELPIPVDLEKTALALEEVFPESSITILPFESTGSQVYRELLGGWLNSEVPPPEAFGEKWNQRSWSDNTWELRGCDPRLKESHSFRVADGSDLRGRQVGFIELDEPLFRSILNAVESSNREFQKRCTVPLVGYYRSAGTPV